MCDLKAYVLKEGREELVLEAVNQLRVDGREVVVRNLFGEERRVNGEINEVSLVKCRVVLIPRAD